MQYLLEVEDNKDKFFMEMLKHFSFIKTHPLSKSNVQFISELQHSVKQVQLAKKGKVKLQKAKYLLNDL